MADSLNKLGDDQNNNLAGDAGDDILLGKEGNDELHGREGQDTLYGGSGNDRVFGGKDDDRAFGGEGNDTLNGGARADILNSGSGQDTLTGGDGAYIFKLVLNGSAADQITDFSVSQGDKIRIDTDTGTEDSLQDLGFSITGNSNAANIVYQSETVLTLSGVSASDMLSGSFDTYFEVVQGLETGFNS